ncbi:MAG: cyclic nucleotide-binding domain-containing protein [Anaerolineae bacterium]
MKTLEPILREHPYFKDLEPRFLELLVGCATNVVYKPDTFICHEGEAANQFYIIRQGQVSLEIYAPGRGPIVLQTLGAGDILGWSWLIPPYRWHSDARALEQTRAIALDGECLRMKCNADHDLGYELLKRFSNVIVASLEAARFQLIDVYGAVPA